MVRTERAYGVDLLRILSMAAIVGLHVLNNGGGMSDATGIGATAAAIRFVISICYCSVNVFAMMTGYLYGERKSIRTSNLVNLILTVAFYCIVVTGIFLVFRPEDLADGKTVLFSLFPPISGKYWYFVSYVFMFLMIPIMNKLISVMTKKQFFSLLIMLFTLLSVVTTFGLFDYFRINMGYSPFWLMFCYMAGAFVRLYVKEERLSKARVFMAVAFIANNALVVVLWLATEIVFREPLGFETYVGYVSPLTVCNALIALCLFSSLKIKNKAVCKVLKSLSGGAFDVYIIHCHPLVLRLFFENKFAGLSDCFVLNALAVIFGTIAAVYVICYGIWLLRSILFKALGINKLCGRIGSKLDCILPLNASDE
ncbi:MAG: acyltransferase [Clostridia bacterium]|nr:acyltransferase [Clostridia bacterium]